MIYGLIDKIDDVLEQEKHILPKKEENSKELDFDFDSKIFNRMANFIINLDPDILSDSQLENILDMIEELEIEGSEENIQESPKLAKMSTVGKNNASKKWYRNNKTEIKLRKEKLKRSFVGRKKEREKERLDKIGRTEMGRKKTRYHVRKRSDRSDREENLNK